MKSRNTAIILTTALIILAGTDLSVVLIMGILSVLSVTLLFLT